MELALRLLEDWVRDLRVRRAVGLELRPRVAVLEWWESRGAVVDSRAAVEIGIGGVEVFGGSLEVRLLDRVPEDCNLLMRRILGALVFDDMVGVGCVRHKGRRRRDVCWGRVPVRSGWRAGTGDDASCCRASPEGLRPGCRVDVKIGRLVGSFV